NIVVMGHGRCGGVHAYLRSDDQPSRRGDFITKWLSIMADARAEALRDAAGEPPEVLQQVMEYASIRRSVGNLESFPFVAEAVRSGSLQLHGAWFDISTGELMSLDHEPGRFDPVI